MFVILAISGARSAFVGRSLFRVESNKITFSGAISSCSVHALRNLESIRLSTIRHVVNHDGVLR
jgi:hypothetical protein